MNISRAGRMRNFEESTRPDRRRKANPSIARCKCLDDQNRYLLRSVSGGVLPPNESSAWVSAPTKSSTNCRASSSAEAECAMSPLISVNVLAECEIVHDSRYYYSRRKQ